MTKQIYKMRFICDNAGNCYTTASEIGKWLESKGVHFKRDFNGCPHYGSKINTILKSYMSSKYIISSGLLANYEDNPIHLKLCRRTATGNLVNTSVFETLDRFEIGYKVCELQKDNLSTGIDIYTEEAIKIVATNNECNYSVLKDADIDNIIRIDKSFITKQPPYVQKEFYYQQFKSTTKLF